MKRLRVIILLMALLQCVVTGILTDTRVFPVVAAALALLAFVRPLSTNLSVREKIYFCLALALFFGVKMRLLPLDIPGRFSPFPGAYEFNHGLAQFLLLCQCALLGAHRFERAETTRAWSALYAIPLLGAVQLATVSDFVGHSAAYRRTSLVGACLFAVLFCLYVLTATTTQSTAHRGFFRHAVTMLLLFVALASGLILSAVAPTAVSRIDVMFFQIVRPQLPGQRTGFSEQSTLRSVSALRDTNADRVALRIESETAPEYLRALARDRFDGRTWESVDAWRPLQADMPPDNMPGRAGVAHRYPVRPQGASATGTHAVWHAAGQTELLFTTLDTAAVLASPALFTVNEHLNCRAEGLPRSRPYLLETGVGPHMNPPDEALRQRCLHVPESLSAEARARCIETLRGASTDAEKIRAVTGFFRQHFTYRLGVNIPSNQDPLSYFLTERPPAHCEYFASAAVIMLRLGGVPSRYATGFVVTEKNRAGNYWVARNRDAHAWAEAWDEARGWVVVEATPPDGMPEVVRHGSFAAFRDLFQFRLRMYWAWLREQGADALWAVGDWLARGLVGSWPGRVLLSVGLVLGAMRIIRSVRSRWSRRDETEEDRIFTRLLAWQDGESRKRGFVRAPEETLHHFAQRIVAADNADRWHERAAAWYVACATLRCRGASPGETVEILSSLRAPQENSPH